MKKARKILVTGPESSGKTTLCEQLGRQLAGAAVRPEVARSYLQNKIGPYEVADLQSIWKEQCRLEKEMESTHPVLICDTAHIVMAVWNEFVFQHPGLALEQLQKDYPIEYELVLLCAPDLEWEPDPLREAPDQEQRAYLFRRYAALLDELSIPHQTISGQGANRLQLALQTIHAGGFSIV